MMKADLHIHTVLSPCGDLDMSPVNIIDEAKRKGLSIIGISDHNSTRQAPVVKEYGEKAGITVLMGVEINTQEEVHCLAFFPTLERLNEFQCYLDLHLPNIPNNPEKFGYQVVVNIEESIIYEEERILVSAIDEDIESVEKTVHWLDGIFIPAHINKSFASILSQLGFVPPGLNCDALEVSSHISPECFLQENTYLKKYAFIQSSDAHYVVDIGKAYTELKLNDTFFESIRKAIANHFVNVEPS
ncbi:MAG: PHP domain-containing protein [Prevotellaceae bacterium]|jgi:PHP family Zn ribbon phosphoesterase|nr:PHP domain-containing protein [Prevotellaceae bacterium]